MPEDAIGGRWWLADNRLIAICLRRLGTNDDGIGHGGTGRRPYNRDLALASGAINVGRLVAPHDDVRAAPFFAALERVNALAEAAPGFVWRLQGEGGNATDLQPTTDPLFIVNMSF